MQPHRASATPTSATPSPSPTPTPKPKQVKASDNFDKVTVDGGFGEAPKVKVPPWAIDQTRTKVLESSKGPVVGEGQSVEVNYYGVNGRTGKKFDGHSLTGSRLPSAWRRSFLGSARDSCCARAAVC